MDLSKIPTDDTPNDATSLEGSNAGATTPETSDPLGKGESLDQDATGNAPVPGDGQPEHKESLIKRLWRRLNIYLLLFVLVVLVAVAVTVFMLVKSKRNDSDQNKITSQGLSESTLSQLSNSDTTVGSPKQILNVASNAIFAGSVLMRSNLEVAGTVKVGGELALPGITVSGNSKLGEVQANSLAVNGPTTVNGVFTGKSGMNITGKSTFTDISTSQLTTGSLQLNGNLKLTNHITAGGPIPGIARGNAVGGGGTASLSGSDTSGSITISTGSAPPAGCFMTVTFQKAFSSTPHIIITPVGSSAADINYYINRTTSNFSICTTNGAPSGTTFGFDYFAVE